MATYLIRERQRLILGSELAAARFLVLGLVLQSPGENAAPAVGSLTGSSNPPLLAETLGKSATVSSLPWLHDLVTRE